MCHARKLERAGECVEGSGAGPGGDRRRAGVVSRGPNGGRAPHAPLASRRGRLRLDGGRRRAGLSAARSRGRRHPSRLCRLFLVALRREMMRSLVAIFVAGFVPALAVAQEDLPWVKLTLMPAAAPKPALKYILLPELRD